MQGIFVAKVVERAGAGAGPAAGAGAKARRDTTEDKGEFERNIKER